MYHHALSTPLQQPLLARQDQKNQGVLTHIELNYLELMCIEMALVGLQEKLCHQHLPAIFLGASRESVISQLRYLRHWLDEPHLREQLRTDGKNSVLWPFKSSELVNWLLAICQTCMSEEAILIVSIDAAGSAYGDYAELSFDEDNISHLASSMIAEHVCAFQRYYNHIMTLYQERLVQKLSDIVRQGYPLFPNFSH